MRTAWADVDVQLNRRHDLVPALVDTVQAYARHERGVMEAVTALRAEALQPSRPNQLARVESQLAAALDKIFALTEAYPELHSSERFGQLQRDLVGVEDQLQYARRFYNGAVRDYNDGRQRIPDRFIAQAFAFAPGEHFQVEEAARAAPSVRVP